MKLLSSDYDLTLNSFDYDLWFNMKFIERFRREGNIFLLNTGRSFEGIKKEIDKYHINYDYLSCVNGNLILNKKNNVLLCSSLSTKILDELSKLKKKYGEFAIIPIVYDDNILEFVVKTKFNNLSFDNDLNQLCNGYNLSFEKVFKKKVANFKLLSGVHYYICDSKINKSTSTSFVSSLENIKKCDIFTIGDNLNDLEMVRDFNGYTLPWGKSELKEVSNGQVLSVASLVKKISR